MRHRAPAVDDHGPVAPPSVDCHSCSGVKSSALLPCAPKTSARITSVEPSFSTWTPSMWLEPNRPGSGCRCASRPSRRDWQHAVLHEVGGAGQTPPGIGPRDHRVACVVDRDRGRTARQRRADRDRRTGRRRGRRSDKRHTGPRRSPPARSDETRAPTPFLTSVDPDKPSPFDSRGRFVRSASRAAPTMSQTRRSGNSDRERAT